MLSVDRGLAQAGEEGRQWGGGGGGGGWRKGGRGKERDGARGREGGSSRKGGEEGKREMELTCLTLNKAAGIVRGSDL